MRLVAEPSIPFALWLTLAVLAIAVWIWYSFTSRMTVSKKRRQLILALMAGCLSLPLILLLNLTWIQRIPPPAGKPVVHVVVDTSASMLTEDANGTQDETGAEQTSRLQSATTIASDVATSMEDAFDVRLWTFNQGINASSADSISAPSETTSADDSSSAMATDLVAALAQAVKEDIPQGQSILLLSDGIHNASESAEVIEAATQAKAMDVPVFTSTIGGKVGVKNIAISFRSPQELAFVGQSIPVSVQIQSQGFPRRPVNLVLSKAGQEVGRQEVFLEPDKVVESTFQIAEELTGLYRYEASVEPINEEATADDNRALLLARIVDQPVKMLLVEGKPYWDTKFLVRRLSADQSLDLTSVIRMSEERFMKRRLKRTQSVTNVGDQGTDDAPPVEIGGVEESTIINDSRSILSAAALSEIQILVLGRNAEYFLTDEALDNLRNWIARDGGALVCARGAPSALVGQRLQQILPVQYSTGRESRFRVSMTSQGEQLRWLASFGDALGAMPSLSTASSVQQRQGLSNVLAQAVDSDSADSIPVISYQPYGSGRTVVVEGAGMWRWALMAPEYSKQEEVYGTLWRSLLRWLVSRAGLLPGQNVSIQPDRVGFTEGDVVTATMLVRQSSGGQAPNVRLRHPDGSTSDHAPTPSGQEPGVFRLDLGQLPSGQYFLETVAANGAQVSGSESAAFDVRSRWIERLELDARNDLMQKIATTSGGAELASTDPTELGKLFKEHLETARPPQYRRVAMWDRWWVMLLVLGLWASTWIVRRQSGLV